MPALDISRLFNATGPAPVVAALEKEVAASMNPLALLPVRLETRFFAMLEGTTELRIRIYPDKIHINSHNSRLTADEQDFGRRFWEAEWRAGNEEAKRREAWRELAERFGPPRAAWIAHSLKPTNPDQRPEQAVEALPVQPKFPDLPELDAFKPEARLLPSCWTCTAYREGAIVGLVTGKDIAADLGIAPDLNAPLVHGDGGDQNEFPAIDLNMAWMVDFEQAEEAGMAMRIALPAPIEAAAIDLLLVAGVRDGDGSGELQRQLDAHHYTDGLAFVPPGTASNNSGEERAGYRAPDPRHDASFAHEWGVEPGDESAAKLTARALGVDAFGTIAGSAGLDESISRAMMTALWPATWGYFLSQMVGFEGELTLEARDWAQAHAIRYLRPGGPLPIIRCGKQPYGLLPVTSLNAWHPLEGNEGTRRLAEILTSLRDNVWRPASGTAALVEPGADPNAMLVEILRTSAASTGFQVRNLIGEHFGRHLRALLGENLDAIGFWTRLRELAAEGARRFGITFDPALVSGVYDEAARPVSGPLVGDPATIAALRDTDDVTALAKQPATASLLEALLRHSLLREHAEATARWLANPSLPRAHLVRDAELVNLPEQPPTPTWSWQRQQTVDGKPASDGTSADPGLIAMRAALDIIASSDTASLERHLSQTLDAAGHRLDAWITSLASWRLDELRQTSPIGITLGGYGWVENLRPAPPGPSVTDLPANEPGPLHLPPEDPGFIHAPSISQASAAALLRNAHLAHGGGPDAPYAIELDSARIRLAKRLFSGVRQGQPLGAMLGYTFERNLHDARMDDLVDDFRNLAPLPGAETPTGSRRLVVDGLTLNQKWLERKDGDDLDILIKSVDAGRQEQLGKILEKLEVAVDAAADAVNAEAAFQMVRGNLPRAAAALETISNGQAPPPDLGFLTTPRTGVPVTHRVVVLLPRDGDTPVAGWASRSPRSDADPVLAAWAGRLLGPGTGIVARVIAREDGKADEMFDVPVDALGLTPIDFVWATAGSEGIPPELVQRVLDAVRQASSAPSADATLEVDFALRGDRAVSVADLIEVASRSQRLLAGARPLTGADLQPPSEPVVRGLDLDEFEARVGAAERSFAAILTELAEAVTSGADPRQALLRAAAFGAPAAIPVVVPGMEASEALVAQARRIIAELTSRVAPATAEPPADAAGQLDQQLARLRRVFGPGFLALPLFSPANAEQISASLADHGSLLGDDPLAPYTWLMQMERVRPALSRMASPLRASAILGLGEKLDLAVGQVPHVAGRRWVGRSVFEGADSCVSLVLQGATALGSERLCGLFVDEWTEVVPSAVETTGIAFQCNLPDSAAPQAILLAVPPVKGEPWRVGNLNRVLLETLDLAHLRAIEPDDLGAVAHYLPATHLAFNTAVPEDEVPDTISTNLRPLAP